MFRTDPESTVTLDTVASVSVATAAAPEPPQVASATIQMSAGTSTPSYRDTGPLLPETPPPTALIEAAAARRLLDEAVAENDPRSPGTTSLTTSGGTANLSTTAATAAAAVVDPATARDIPDLPEGGAPLQLVTGPDGTLYRIALIATVDEDTGLSSYTTTVTKINPAGGTPVVTTIPGSAGLGSFVVTTTGRAYQTTYHQSSNTATVTHIGQNGQTSTTVIDGTPVGPLQAGPGGRVHQTTYRSGYDPATGTSVSETVITSVGADGVSTTVVQGAPAADGGLTVASNGTLYQVTSGYNATGLTTTVTKVTPAGTSATTIAGTAAGRVVVAADGTAYVSTYAFDPAENAVVTTVYSIGSFATPIAAMHSAAILDGLVVAADGTVYQTTYRLDPASPTSGTTTVTVVRPSSTSTATMNGVPLSGVVVGPDGTAYQTTYDQQSKTTYVTSVTPSGTVATSSTAGSPVGRSVVVAPDGTAYQVVALTVPDPNTPHAVQSTVTVIQLKANAATALTFAGAVPVGEVVIGSDGRAYLVTGQISYDPADPASAAIQTIVTSLGPAGPVRVSAADGMAMANLAATAGNRGWLITRTGQPDAYDDRAWLLTLGAAGPATPPTDTRPPLIRQLERFVRAVTSVPAAIARAAAVNLVRTMAAAAEATAQLAANAARAAERLSQDFGKVIADTFFWAGKTAADFVKVNAEVAKLLGLPGPGGTKLVARFLPLIGMGVSAYELGEGLGNLMTGRPVSGALGLASGMVGLAGGAFMVLPFGQPIGLGLLGISAGLSGAGLLLNTFVPELDTNVNRFLQDVERNTARAATDFVDGVARTADSFARGAREFADGAVDFINNPKPPWEWKLW